MNSNRRPAVFIGSSVEGLRVAEALQVLLDRECEVTIWSQGVFGPGIGTFPALMTAAEQTDYAILILTPDVTIAARGAMGSGPRDNVLVELGLFSGRLGTDRVFMVYDRTSTILVPTDMAGITAVTYQPHSTGNFQAALGATATQIRDRIHQNGLLAAATSEREPVFVRTDLSDSGLIIRRAVYGAGDRWIDVTRQLQRLVDGDRLETLVGNWLGGDPAFGIPKNIKVDYSWRGGDLAASVPEGVMLSLPLDA